MTGFPQTRRCPTMSGVPPRSRVASIACVLVAGLGLSAGCAVFTKPVVSSGPPALNWLTHFVTPPLQQSSAFDLNSLKPAKTAPQVDAGALLEITIWDLYEPGKAHSFPVRLNSTGAIEAPFLGELSVRGKSPAEIETLLSQTYIEEEILLQPRILVRELEAPGIKIYVTGAVNRPGLVELRRNEANVYAALVSAGGLSKSAGSHILVTRRDKATPENASAASSPATFAPHERLGAFPPATIAGEPQLRSNSGETLSVQLPAEQLAANHPTAEIAPAKLDHPVNPEQSVAESVDPLRGIQSQSPQTVTTLNKSVPPADAQQLGKWYDILLEKDCRLLSELQLLEGDILNVKQAAAPVRITGAVVSPGSYPLPAGNALNVWEALQMAGGLSARNIPIHVSLTRPPTEERGSQRWSLTLGSSEPWPRNAPFLQPGDALHVETTTRGKVQRAVGELWNLSPIP